MDQAPVIPLHGRTVVARRIAKRRIGARSTVGRYQPAHAMTARMSMLASLAGRVRLDAEEAAIAAFGGRLAQAASR
jgi:hypothetical protein